MKELIKRAWGKNANKLREYYELKYGNKFNGENLRYDELLREMSMIIFDKYNVKNIKTIIPEHDDYQGEAIYEIELNVKLRGKVEYGSCVVCDSLMGARDISDLILISANFVNSLKEVK